MSVNDLLSQDEIDALLHGVSSDDVETQDDDLDNDEARSYDFSSQDRIVRGRMPTLEMIKSRPCCTICFVARAYGDWPASP